MSQFTFVWRGACYPLDAGDFRGPALGAAGTRHFEPDGVIFLWPGLPPSRFFQPPMVSRQPLKVALPDQIGADALQPIPFALQNRPLGRDYDDVQIVE